MKTHKRRCACKDGYIYGEQIGEKEILINGNKY